MMRDTAATLDQRVLALASSVPRPTLSALSEHGRVIAHYRLVHYTDGVEGTRKRIEAARKVVPRFGVATECGFGRRPSETVEPLMKIHAGVAAPLD